MRYAGEYQDAETGLYYLRARYYDPTTQQFLTRDPLVAATEQAYNYAAGSPLNAKDPSGLYPAGPDVPDDMPGIRSASGLHKLSGQQLKRWASKWGYDKPEDLANEIKEHSGRSRVDLYYDDEGNVYTAPKKGQKGSRVADKTGYELPDEIRGRTSQSCEPGEESGDSVQSHQVQYDDGPSLHPAGGRVPAPIGIIPVPDPNGPSPGVIRVPWEWIFDPGFILVP